MNRQKFTQEQVQLLRKNPYTKSVTPSQLRFTQEFKDEFRQACLEGKTAPEFFQDKGYDVDLIGQKRMENLQTRVFRELAQPQESSDVEQEMQMLKSEVKRLSFELDLLKKIISMANSKK